MLIDLDYVYPCAFCNGQAHQIACKNCNGQGFILGQEMQDEILKKVNERKRSAIGEAKWKALSKSWL